MAWNRNPEWNEGANQQKFTPTQSFFQIIRHQYDSLGVTDFISQAHPISAAPPQPWFLHQPPDEAKSDLKTVHYQDMKDTIKAAVLKKWTTDWK